MSKKSKLASLVLAAALLSGCQSTPSTPTAEEGQTPPAAVTTSTSTETTTETTPVVAGETSTETTTTVAGETAAQGTPEAATQAFITAAVAKDTEALKTLMAPDAEKEFAGLRDGTADANSITELSEMFMGATVGKVELEDNGQEAEVEVTLKERQESIELANTPEGWKVKGF